MELFAYWEERHEPLLLLRFLTRRRILCTVYKVERFRLEINKMLYAENILLCLKHTYLW